MAHQEQYWALVTWLNCAQVELSSWWPFTSCGRNRLLSILSYDRSSSKASGLKRGDAVLTLAALLVCQARGRLGDLKADTLVTRLHVTIPRRREPANERDQKQYWERRTALRCRVVGVENEWLTTTGWLAWARA
jgi:hypothetical protein